MGGEYMEVDACDSDVDELSTTVYDAYKYLDRTSGKVVKQLSQEIVHQKENETVQNNQVQRKEHKFDLNHKSVRSLSRQHQNRTHNVVQSSAPEVCSPEKMQAIKMKEILHPKNLYCSVCQISFTTEQVRKYRCCIFVNGCGC